MNHQTELRNILNSKKLKTTPQRIAVYKALIEAGDSHPAAEDIYNEVIKTNPGLSRATVYRILEKLVENGLAGKALTNKDIMKYDPVTEAHHHLYFEDTNVLKDYKDEELEMILENYFKNKKIPGFEIRKFKLYIEGVSK